ERNDAVVDQERAVETAQAAYLARCAPGYRTRRVRWSGGTTQVIELGDSAPLVLVHGGLGEASQWGCILSALARRHRVLAVDRPGHGLADPFDYRGVDLLSHARWFLGARWQGLAVATTFVWGERGAFGAPEEAEALAAKNPHFTVVRIPDAGHVPWLDDPEKV